MLLSESAVTQELSSRYGSPSEVVGRCSLTEHSQLLQLGHEGHSPCYPSVVLTFLLGPREARQSPTWAAEAAWQGGGGRSRPLPHALPSGTARVAQQMRPLCSGNDRSCISVAPGSGAMLPALCGLRVPSRDKQMARKQAASGSGTSGRLVLQAPGPFCASGFTQGGRSVWRGNAFIGPGF